MSGTRKARGRIEMSGIFGSKFDALVATSRLGNVIAAATTSGVGNNGAARNGRIVELVMLHSWHEHVAVRLSSAGCIWMSCTPFFNGRRVGTNA